MRPVVVEAWQYAARCRGCGHRTKGTYPAGLEPTRTFGPQLEALLGYFHERHHVSYERLVEVCRDVFGLTHQRGRDRPGAPASGRACPADLRGAGRRGPGQPVIGSDETGARVAGRTAWHWVFQTPTASYHVIVPRRNADVIAAFLGDTRPEGWVSDLWSPQLQVDAETHQICLAHQIREPDLRRRGRRLPGPGLGGRAAPPVRTCHPPAPAPRDDHPGSFIRRRRRIENAVDRLVFRTFLPERPDTANARRLQERYREHRASLFVFLDPPDVPPTNNASEQDLRPSVIHRKVTGGYRSQRGARCSPPYRTSLLTTARKRGQNLLDALRSIAGASPLQAAGMAD